MNNVFIYSSCAGKPPSVSAWLTQCALYMALMVVEKVLVTLLVQLSFWEEVRHFILAPIQNPRVELALVMLIIPFFVNVSKTSTNVAFITRLYQ